jgi:hypothetical protein
MAGLVYTVIEINAVELTPCRLAGVTRKVVMDVMGKKTNDKDDGRPLWKEKQISAQDRVRTGDSWLIRPVL